MANHYYGINRGDQIHQAVVSSSTTGKEIEVVVNTDVNTRLALLLALRNLEGFVTDNVYPPL